MQEEVHTQHLGYAVIGTDTELPRLSKDYEHAFITVGQIGSPDTRIRLYQRALEKMRYDDKYGMVISYP